MRKSFEMVLIGGLGWILTNVSFVFDLPFWIMLPEWFESLGGVIVISSSAMGGIMLFISIRIGVIDYRLKKISYERRKKDHEDWRKEIQKIIKDGV